MKIDDNVRFQLDAQLSSGDGTSKNILIHGDNKDVLTELYADFGGRIRCIYIDPPYNNGETYHYYDDNTQHANWLSGIRGVLTQLKPLLAKNGSIWISIDDGEMAYLRIEADKIFGRENFAGTIIWQQRKSRENRAAFSCNHEYILVYAKDLKEFKKSRNLLPAPKDFVASKYKNPDNDPRGPWQSVTVNVQAGHAVESQFYTVVSPTGVRHDPPKGRCWIYNEERMKREIAAGNIWFGLDGRNTPRLKKFLHDSKIGLTPETIWLADEVGTSDSAKKQLMTLFPDKTNIFETPKPEELIKRVIEIASNEGDYVLDCYVGSGTTVAVAHKLNRHYVGIEIGEQMSELVVSRLRRVVEGEQTGISQVIGWQGGGDFSLYTFNRNVSTQRQESAQLHTATNIPVATDPKKKVTYKQLDLFETLKRYPDYIVNNESVLNANELDEHYINLSKSVLISYVKADNEEQYIDRSAKIYYTGKRFPDSVGLNKLFYFMPYLKGRGVRDLYLIKIARVGSRKEGQIGNNPNDYRLVFEIEYLQQLFDDYKYMPLVIWHTFTDTTVKDILQRVNKLFETADNEN